MDEEKEEGPSSPKRPPEKKEKRQKGVKRALEEWLRQYEEAWARQREEERARQRVAEIARQHKGLKRALAPPRQVLTAPEPFASAPPRQRLRAPRGPNLSAPEPFASARPRQRLTDVVVTRHSKEWEKRIGAGVFAHPKSDPARSVADEPFLTERLIQDDSAPVRPVLRARRPTIEWEKRIGVLRDIQTLGPEATEAYQNALEAGKVEVYRAQIMLIGQDRAGKTSLKRSLLGLPFDPYQQSTDGIEVDPSRFEIGVEQVQNWQPIDKKTGTSLFGNHLLRIMAGELSGKITKTNLDVQKRPEEKSSEHDKAPPKKASHGESNTEALEPDMTELKIDPALPPTEFINPLVEKLKGLKPPTDSSQHITLEIWDFAGQHLYYASYPIFLSPRAVYLLIYNLSKGLKDIAQPYVRQGGLDIPLINPNEETNLERLLSWLVTVSTMCSTQSNMDEKKREDLPYNRPPIFIVGTHADKPFQDIKQVESEIQKEISEMEYVGHVIRPFYYIDNTQGCSGDGVGALKKKLLEILKQEPYMGEELPLRWFNFERVVQALVAKEVYFLKLGALHTIIQKFCKIDSEIEVAAMLDFYHKLRVIVKHNETVVLQTQWLINVFKQLITIRPFNDMEPRHQKWWKEMERTGILRMELVSHVFSKVCQERVIREDILNMMEMFGLIAKFETPTSGAIYFVPAQLSTPPGPLREMKPSPSDPCELYFLFPGGFVPYGLFSQLLSRCTKWCSENKFYKRPRFFEGAARFFIEKKCVYQLIILSRKRYLKVLLRQTKRAGDREMSLGEIEDVASSVRCFLEDSLNGLSVELPWLRSLKYELCVACPYCPEEKATCPSHGQACCTHEDCLCLLKVLPGGQIPICENCFPNESLKVPGLEMWFPTTIARPDTEPTTDNEVNRTAPSSENESVSDGLSSTQTLLQLGKTQGTLEAYGDKGEEGKKRIQKNPDGAGTSCSDSQQTSESLKVCLLASGWKSSKGGLSTINRKLAMLLAEYQDVEVTVLVPSCSEEDKKAADCQNVTIVEVEPRPGYEPVDWLIFPPDDLAIDVVLGHGAILGRQAQAIRNSHRCKWVQVVHTDPEELAMHKQYERAITRGEEKSRNEVDLCKLSDLVVAVGPKLWNSITSKLRSCEKHQDIFQLIPGIFSEFSDVRKATRELDVFNVLTFGRGDSEDFSLKGYDIGPEAIVKLDDRSYRLIFVGAPEGKQEEVADKLLSCEISKNQLVVRSFVQSREELKNLLCEADLAIMPSRAEGFGLTALEALSANLPILVGANSGFAEVLRSLPFGESCVVESEKPEEWAKAISTVRRKNREKRLEEIQSLRKNYEKKYSWQKQCGSLVKRMWSLVYGEDEPSRHGASSKRC